MTKMHAEISFLKKVSKCERNGWFCIVFPRKGLNACETVDFDMLSMKND